MTQEHAAAAAGAGADTTAAGALALAEYRRQRTLGDARAARHALQAALAGAPESAWLDCSRALVLSGDLDAAHAVLAAGMAAHPGSTDLRFALAGVLYERSDPAQAELLLRELLEQRPAHAAAVFLLARLLRQQGRLGAVAAALRALFAHDRHPLATVIQAVELLDDCGRQQDAAAICQAEIASGCTDPRIYAYAGMLELQLGAFEDARRHYAYVLAHDQRAPEWNIPIGLSSMQRYRDAGHPDFQLFRDTLQQERLSDRARSTTLFALGKAHDDIGDYARAANYLRQANAIAHKATGWSRKQWRRRVDSQLARQSMPFELVPPDDWTPVFMVGVPRSGTTLVAELLAQHPDVCNRGELPWLGHVAQSLSLHDESRVEAFEQAATTYAAQLRQDDSDATWFIDKQPLNLLHVDLVLALWPNARIVFCQRNARDTALSLWSQSFLDDAHGYAYDFADIAVVARDCLRLMTRWQQLHATSIHAVAYERLVADPAAVMADIAGWLGLPPFDPRTSRQPAAAISTASLWQARQPIHTGSVGRWRHYAAYLPELLRIPER